MEEEEIAGNNKPFTIDSNKDTESNMATVQVRWIHGSLMLIVKVPVNSIVNDIKREVRNHFKSSDMSNSNGSTECPNFELRSAYPPRLLPDDMSLEEAGLIPNGTVHARKIE